MDQITMAKNNIQTAHHPWLRSPSEGRGCSTPAMDLITMAKAS
jgi:hypothetical protein